MLKELDQSYKVRHYIGNLYDTPLIITITKPCWLRLISSREDCVVDVVLYRLGLCLKQNICKCSRISSNTLCLASCLGCYLVGYRSRFCYKMVFVVFTNNRCCASFAIIAPCVGWGAVFVVVYGDGNLYIVNNLVVFCVSRCEYKCTFVCSDGYIFAVCGKSKTVRQCDVF